MDLKRAIMELQCEMVAERNSVNPKNISWLQYDILSQIKKLEKILPSDLSIILGISRTKLSKALKGLKSKGYIAQFPNKLDGRELYTTLTDEGNKLLEDIEKKHTSIFEIASKSFTKEEQKYFIRLSNILSNELRKNRLEKDE
ncbi:MarR family winged helix-turn-helix transcriptional regulator [Globicatella sulfidifaciens]|uniref:DNA-binding transcriptional regulator, MarR family n=1 Tax=Globicatella sulfidifaciens DSM 15739 TaxID=1121925 RepID=A0A1T4L0C0_9LACT|nr:MarR family transcriptional regulator [Globicatella sulfidifaciens]SJZ48048.1 DNA-binding transcriptional regulator, MarR family [Globicatella sulfidifaciens DSM 15739]